MVVGLEGFLFVCVNRFGSFALRDGFAIGCGGLVP